MRFNIGDEVYVNTHRGCDAETRKAHHYRIRNGGPGQTGEEKYALQSEDENNAVIGLCDNLCFFKDDISLTSTKTSTNQPKNNYNMTIIEKFKQLTMKEPEKTFVKAGIANADGTLNSDGTKLFLEFLVAKFGVEFKTEVVDKIVAADEAAKQ